MRRAKVVLTGWGIGVMALVVWSSSLTLVEARDLDVVISEIHYHPVTSDADEFLELHNLSDDAVDLSAWYFSSGVFFVFPEKATIGPHEYLVVAKDAAGFAARYGDVEVLGDYEGQLANGGETVALRNSKGLLVERVAYDDGDPWPGNPDGLGPSLERTMFVADGEQQWVWRSSIPVGGTPGAPNSTLVERNSRELIQQGDTWRYFKGRREPASPIGSWANPSFSDAAWQAGPSGFGYGDGDDATVLSDMRGSYTTVYIRKTFTIDDPTAVESLTLGVTYDDGFVAYLNGVEVWRSASAGGSPGTPLRYNARAAGSHESDEGSDVVELAGLPALRAGENVLAIQVLNENVDSSDLSMIPALHVTETGAAGYVEPAHDLEINEVVAATVPSEGYVEIYNEGASAADLSGYRLTTDPLGAGGYSFAAGTTLAANAFLVVPADSLPFELLDTAQWIGLVTADALFVDGVRTDDRPAARPWGRWPDGDGDTFVLDEPTPGAANTFTPDDRVVITEIRYNPPVGQGTEEYIELFNRSDAAVDMAGWKLRKAVGYTFPDGVVLPPQGYLVVSGDPASVEARYGIAGVLGPWRGALSSADEKIELADTLGNRADVVHYADDGTWPSSTATSGPDGFGPSIELVHMDMESNNGSAWRASAGAGTPQSPNSRSVADPPPVIRSTKHSPAQPRSGQSVTVTTRVADERGVSTVRIFYRNDGASTFASRDMTPGGGDHWNATLPARNSGTIVQFYISATDTTGHTRTYPAGAPTHVCLYQVDDSAYPSGLPLYRLVMRQRDFDTLTARDVGSDVLLDGTFIRGKDITYGVGVRYRGEHSRNYWRKAFRIQFSHDNRFEGITRLNLNAEDTHLSHLATNFLRRCDVPTFQSRVVAFTANRNFGTAYGGVYERVEAMDRDFLRRAFPGDDGGNLYRGLDLGGGRQADLSYRGANASDYEGIYVKKTNEEEKDYSDIIELTNAFAYAPDDEFVTRIWDLVDVDEWLRFFAAEAILSNQDGAIATQTGEDYFLYRRPSDGLFVILPWDQNETFRNPGGGFFRMSSAAVQRLVQHPELVRRYLATSGRLLDGPFDQELMTPWTDSLRESYAQDDLDAVAAFIPQQEQAIRASLPERLTVGVEPEYFVRSGDTWKFFRGTREPSGGSTAWTGRTFNDSSWEEGPGGFGYGDGDDRTVLTDMRDNYTTVYIRHRFTVDDPGSVTGITLSVRYDDGFVAYLNGTEIARKNVSGSVRYDERASGDHEAGAPTTVAVPASRLVAGTNVLAAVGVNVHHGSSDLTLDPELYAPPQGSGCGNHLFADGNTVSLGGTAPVLATAAVEVNGEAAAYDPSSGNWYHEVQVDTGNGDVLVRALDVDGQEVAATTVTVFPGGSLTSVGGTLSTRTWTAAASPYHVTQDITIRSGNTLTVEAGTVVLVEQGRSFTVQGTLNAAGTAVEPVVFQGSSCEGTWGGFVFTGSGARGLLQHCEFMHASGVESGGTSYPAAVNLAAGAQVRVENCRLANLESPGIEAKGQSTQLRVFDTLIEDGMEGIHCDTAFADLERVHIRDLFGKSDCVDFDNDSTPRSVISNCIFENGPDDGIDLGNSSALMEGNFIRNMADKGISLEGVSSPHVALTVISGCNGAIACKDSVTATIERCTLTGNAIGLHLYEKNSGKGGGHATADSLIVWDDGRSIVIEDSASLSLTYSDVAGTYPGAGNGDFNPLFVNPVSADFHLQSGSPALGAGKGGVDMGALPASGPVVPTFLRGDANRDGEVDISDAMGILLHLFAGGMATSCEDAMDADDSGVLDITDAVSLLGFLFQGGAPPPPPFPNRGVDPSEDPLDCSLE